MARAIPWSAGHGSNGRSILRAPLIHGVLCSGALELLVMLVMLGVVGLLLGGGPLREHRGRAGFYALVMRLLPLAWLAQGYSLLISDAFVSPMAPENMHVAARPGLRKICGWR